MNGQSFVVGTQLNPRGGGVFLSHLKHEICTLLKVFPLLCRHSEAQGSSYLHPAQGVSSPQPCPALCAQHVPASKGFQVKQQRIDHLGVAGLWAAENQKCETQKKPTWEFTF